MLKVENLHFGYGGLKVLQNISFEVEKGQLCALFGPNGTGKTTLLKCIARLLNYENGDVIVNYENINKMKESRIAKLIAYVPQEHRPPFPYLVKEVVLMGRTPHMGGTFGPSKKDIKAAIEAIEMIGIANIADRPYTALSGGQRQLVLLARAFAQETKILLLDEPTSNLDFQNQIKIWRIIKKLTKNGITALTCTHDPNHVSWFCDKVIVLGSNGIIANGSPAKALTEEKLNKVYGGVCSVRIFDGLQIVIPKRDDYGASTNTVVKEKYCMVNKMEDFDWNGMWKELLQNASWNRRTRFGDMVKFWDKRARKYSESIKHNNHADRIITKLDIDHECTVLDIGSGPGTLSIPLAKRTKHVTAVDPSSSMLACLKENAVSEGLRNITCINKKWEDVEIGTDITEYDIVLASHSLTMPDIKEAVSKMNDVARQCVYIFTFAGAQIGAYNTLWPKLYGGEKYQPGPDYICLYNVLYEMGVYANVEITNSEYKQHFSSLDEAVEQWKENLAVSSPEAEEIIRSYLAENLIEEDGELWSKREMKRAMVWWQKGEK